MTLIKDILAENQDCLICLANARAAMEAINEVEALLTRVSLTQRDRMYIKERTKLAWYALHLRKSNCHGFHTQEMSTNILKSK